MNMRSFAELVPLKAELQGDVDRQTALDIITPPYPDGSGRYRVGMSKRGWWCRYQRNRNGWIFHKECSPTEIQRIIAIGDEVVEFRVGPAGIKLLHHIEEPWE